tara:strand:+ start:1308 stop:1850 length:543 start_codon:yes stop_codon:yes gene_type:complete
MSNNELNDSIEWKNYGYDYCSYLVAKHVLPKLNIPNKGSIVQIGCALGLALEKMCDTFGPDRVVGYDIINPLNHPNIKVMNCENLSEEMEIAFCEIDVAAAATHPELRLHCLNWSMKNMLPGGKILFNNNFSSKHYKMNIEEYMLKNGYEVEQLKKYESVEFTRNIMKSRINTKMICTKL